LLSGWEKQAGHTRESGSRKTPCFSDQQIAFVVEQYKSYIKDRKKVMITAFVKHLKKSWKEQSWLTPAPSRQTVKEMLLANGYGKVNERAIKSKQNYHPPVKRYFPHAQSVLDGKEVVVSLSGQDYKFVLEFSKDMASDGIGGYAVGKSESYELVKAAFNQHCSNHQKPLAVLMDNGKGNGKAAIDLGAEGVLVINSYPYRPQTKGQIEGEFSIFEKKISHIIIDGKGEEQQAMNILKIIAEMYLRLRNEMPRCSVCPFTPGELMKAQIDAKEKEKVYEHLKAGQALKKEQEEKRLKISQELSDLLESIVKEHCLSGDFLSFKKSIKWVELSTIKEAEVHFSAQGWRDNFDSAKRTMAYFYGIARNLQNQKDHRQREQTARRRYGLEASAMEEREKIKAELNEKKTEQLWKKKPYLKIIAAIQAETDMPPSLRSVFTIFKKMIDQGILEILNKKKQNRKSLIEKTHQAILEVSEYSMEIRYDWIQKIDERIEILTKKNVKSCYP